MTAACPYQIRMMADGWYVVRPIKTGGYFTVDGPFLTLALAEDAALKRWRSGASKRRAA